MTADAIGASQARRDRERLKAATAELLALRRRVAELNRSPSRRVFAPARWVVQRLRTPASVEAVEADPSRGDALIVDDHWPQPDRDGGSLEIVNLAETLGKLGFTVTLAAVRQHAGVQPARDALRERGLRCLGPEQAASVQDYLVSHGGLIDLCVLCRVFAGGALMEQARATCGAARFVFHAIDLNWLREERRARLLNDVELLAHVPSLRAREEQVIRECDATIVVSQAEVDLLAATLPGSLVVHLPLARNLQPPTTPFSGRSGIGFLGGFAHAPNTDAVRNFLADTWPIVARVLPECPFLIAGADPPPGLADGAPGDVRVLGHVPDLQPWFESMRATVAPLRFGAGAKGKVASSLAAGVPCVASGVAVEGMALGESEGVLVADAPAEVAAALTRLCTDEVLWTRLSEGAQAYAVQSLSIAGWEPRLDAMARRIGF